jgi:hypothetical protein
MKTVTPVKLALALAIATLAACGNETETSSPPAPVAEATTAAAAAAAAPPATASGCDPAQEQGVTYICGTQGAEDLLSLGSTGLILASGMSSEATPGHMYLINPMTQAVTELVHAPTFTQAHDTMMFPDCPGPVNSQAFSVHGLSIAETSPGVFSVYTTSHGEREAIEAYELNTSGAAPALTWKGCVVLPANTFANSVARLPDGGFVTTKMMDPAQGFGSIQPGAVTGNVYEWHPGGEVTFVEGTELSGANGIDVSPDGQTLFVAAFGSREIVKFDRSTTPATKTTMAVDVVLDNIRWGLDGKLLTAGNNAPAEGCEGAACQTGWSVLEIDPDTLEATRLGGADQTAALQGVSSALQIGDQIWVGTFNDDRIGHFTRN